MHKATQDQITIHHNSDKCSVKELPSFDSAINFAIINISGRYPEVDRATNLKCKEMAYVTKGNGKVVVEGKEYTLNAGDLILIDAGEKFYWEGDLELHISCTPAFTIDQHQHVK
jgi:mannose-6-phosphate isomerase-like protein (cupin superfamily)